MPVPAPDLDDLPDLDLPADEPGLDDDVPEPLVDEPSLEDVDLVVGAPPEDLGVTTSQPPEDLAIVTGHLEPDDDAYLDGEPADADDDPEATPETREARRRHRFDDRLDADDELLPAARKEQARPPAKVGGNRVAAFLRASWAELQRVQWPNRRQVGQATAVVLGFVVIAGGYLGLADLISQSIVDAIL
ncbi:MAG: preprotein translocase subunit SecE [Solirubrobacteraceae bacterium]|nr:preprotein translocase subunit SecE [Solirubrobacteraceae bacterium]